MRAASWWIPHSDMRFRFQLGTTTARSSALSLRSFHRKSFHQHAVQQDSYHRRRQGRVIDGIVDQMSAPGHSNQNIREFTNLRESYPHLSGGSPRVSEQSNYSGPDHKFAGHSQHHNRDPQTRMRYKHVRIHQRTNSDEKQSHKSVAKGEQPVECSVGNVAP